MSEEQVYSLEEAVCPVKIGTDRYLVVEADGLAGTEYRNAGAKGIKFNAKGKPCGVDGIVDAQLILVSKCLFKLVKDNDTNNTLKSWTDPVDQSTWYRQRVNIELIRSWADRISQSLFDKARELSGMKNDDEDADKDETAKNS